MVMEWNYARAVREVRETLYTHDFGNHGFSETAIDAMLAENGYAVRRLHQRTKAPWPCPPFAPVHLVTVQLAGPHLVVMRDDGRVLDPGDRGRRNLSLYPIVTSIAGVYRVRS